MADAEHQFLPPSLALADDDVLDAVEIVAEPDDEGDELEVEGDADAIGGGVTGEAFRAPPGVDAERVSGFDGVGTRRESRERALALLYEAEQRAIAPVDSILASLPVPPEAFAAELVVGVSGHQQEIDDTISRLSVGWPLERMPALDRALLRLGIYELGWTDVPVGAVISEAVELAKRYSTDDSHKFINGVLARVATESRP